MAEELDKKVRDDEQEGEMRTRKEEHGRKVEEGTR